MLTRSCAIGVRPRLTPFVGLLVFCSSGCPGQFATGSADPEHGFVSFDVAADGETVVFSSADGDLYRVDLNTLKVSQLTDTSAIETALAISPDGHQIVYQRSETGNSSGSDWQCHLWTCRDDGSDQRQLTHDAKRSDTQPTYSRDGSRIAFARAARHRRYSMGGWTWDDFGICVIDQDGTQTIELTPQEHHQIQGVAFGEADEAILFGAREAPYPSKKTPTIWRVSISGETPPSIVAKGQPASGGGGAWASNVHVSDDGSLMTFISDRASAFHYDVFVSNSDGTDLKPLGVTSMSRYNQSPRFTADGKRIYFLAATEWGAGNRPRFGLWVVKVDGTDAAEVAGPQLFDAPMQWYGEK